MPNSAIQEKRQLAAARAQQAEERLAAGEIEQMSRLLEEAEMLMKAAEQIETNEKRLAALNGDLGTPVQTIPLSGGTEAKLQALTPAGSTQIDVSAKGVVADGFGEGFLTVKQRAAIREPDYKRAFDSYLRKGLPGLNMTEVKTLQEGSDTAGGFLVPEDVLQRLISKVPAPTNVAGKVTRITTSRDSVVVPAVNYATDDIYTTGIRATWTGEIPASSTAMRVTDPVFGQRRIEVFTAMLSMPLTNNMVEDAAFPVQSYATDKFSETIDLLYDDRILNGTGVGQPTGILVNPNAANNPATVVSAASGVIDADTLIQVVSALPPQYDMNAAWVFNKNSFMLKLSQLKDGNGRYLWGSGLQDSGMVVPFKDRQLLGYDVVLNQLMPNVATSAYPAIFGDLGGYWMINRVGFSIQVLKELYAETNQILLLGRLRWGGQVVEDWKLKIYQIHS